MPVQRQESFAFSAVLCNFVEKMFVRIDSSL